MPDFTPIPPANTADDLLGRKLGQFRIESRIGEGGMGIVYRAVDETLKRPVALKVLPPGRVGDARRHARLMREAQSLAQLAHANIATVFAVGEQDEVVYIAMELVDGPSLSQLLDRGRMNVERVVSISTDVARALAHAHESGLVHRDLKPSNVVLRREREVKLLDFGLAKLLDPGPSDVSGSDETVQQLTTAEGALVGTPVYMSPEQARGTKVDARSDVFSFGTMLYEMLTGTLPFAGDTAMDTLYAIAHAAPEPLAGRADVPAELARIASKCLEKNPELRYQNTQHLVEDLEAFARGASTLSASGSSGLDRTRDYRDMATGPVSRPRRTAWIVAAAAVVIAGGAGVAWYVTRGAGPGETTAAAPPAPTQRPAVTARALTKRSTSNPLRGQPTITSDGKLMVYADDANIWVRAVSGGTPRRLELPDGFAARRFDAVPGTSRVLAVAANGKGAGELIDVDLDTGEVIRRLPAMNAYFASVSPDGSTAATIMSGGLYSVDLESGERKLIADVGVSEIVFALRWSPDGKYLAMVRRPGMLGPSDAVEILEVIARDGSSVRRVLSDTDLGLGVGAAGLEWMPSGYLVYSLARGAGSAIYRIAMTDGAPTGEPELVYELPDAHAIRFSGAGTSLLITTFRSQTDVYLAPLTDRGKRLGKLERVTFERGLDWANDWTADGHLVLESDRFGTRDVFVCESLDKPERVYSDVPLRRNVTRYRDSLLFWQRSKSGDEELDLVRAPVAGGEPTVLFSAKEEVIPEVHCAREADVCLFGQNRYDAFVLQPFDPMTGELGADFFRRPRTDYPKHWSVSPSGASVALVEGEMSAVIVAVPSGDARELRLTGALQYVTWSADGKRLFISGMGVGARYGILSVDLQGNSVLLWGDEVLWTAMPVASPDGKQLAVNIRDWDTNLWLLQGL